MEPHLIFLDLHTTPPRPMPPPEAAVYCLGNFDGVHLAHRAVLSAGIHRAQSFPDAVQCGLFCFFRPSADYKPGASLHEGTHLTTLKQKLQLCAAAGVDFACLCHFEQIRHLSPDAFCDLLVRRCHARGVVCGFNYRFGAGGAGQPAKLQEIFQGEHLAGAIVLPRMEVEGLTVSSTHIRQALVDGRPEVAAKLLERPYALEGRVVHGQHVGHTLGFPTANQFFPLECLIPKHGVYAARVCTPHGIYPGVANVGVRPTVSASGASVRVNCETHLLGFSGDLYETYIRVELIKFLRPEQRFHNLDALRQAIARDASASADILTSSEAWRTCSIQNVKSME